MGFSPFPPREDVRGAGCYALQLPELGKPNLDPLPVTEWPLDKLNEGAP
ncbi:MAG TPA: hypothetical protein VMR90_02930 [Candidatus Cybelea sp.]|nr:hypothetical protein [Candidatus Cybelea sp.]